MKVTEICPNGNIRPTQKVILLILYTLNDGEPVKISIKNLAKRANITYETAAWHLKVLISKNIISEAPNTKYTKIYTLLKL